MPYVTVPPEIEDGPTEVQATVRTRTQLLCLALGLPAPTVTWTKNDQHISPTGPNYRMHRTGTLEFSSVNVEDTGSYTCTASNEAGNASRTVNLKVQGELSVMYMETQVSQGRYSRTSYDISYASDHRPVCSP